MERILKITILDSFYSSAIITANIMVQLLCSNVEKTALLFTDHLQCDCFQEKFLLSQSFIPCCPFYFASCDVIEQIRVLRICALFMT